MDRADTTADQERAGSVTKAVIYGKVRVLPIPCEGFQHHKMSVYVYF